MTELEQLKEAIESGDSIIEAFEQVDTAAMTKEGNGVIAGRIKNVLDQVQIVLDAAGVE